MLWILGALALGLLVAAILALWPSTAPRRLAAHSGAKGLPRYTVRRNSGDQSGVSAAAPR
jgi:hypothetical protein|nr:hypothetical protein [Phenylobacterium sp.]